MRLGCSSKDELCLVFCGVEAGEGFLALDTGSALAAVAVVALVAGVSVGIIDAEFTTAQRDIAFSEGSVGGEERHTVGGAGLDGAAHGNDEWLAMSTCCKPWLSAMPAAMLSMTPLRKGTMVDFMFVSS